jgi:hypothetical protein
LLFFSGKDRERTIEHCHWLPSSSVPEHTGRHRSQNTRDGQILSPQSSLRNCDYLTSQPLASNREDNDPVFRDALFWTTARTTMTFGDSQPSAIRTVLDL